jgi:glycosyltransferase involved in cell wall biosynthesis
LKPEVFIVGPLPLLDGFALGPARYIHDLANSLQEHGLRVTVIAQRDAWRDPSARYGQVNFWTAGSLATFPALYWFLLGKRARVVNVHHDVHVYGEKLAEITFVAFLALCRLSGIRVVTTEYYAKTAGALRHLAALGIITRGEYAPLLFAAYRAFITLVTLLSRRVFVSDPASIEAFPQWVRSRVRFVALVSARPRVLPAELARVREHYSLPDRYILFFGNVGQYKGLESFIAAARALSNRIAFVATGGLNVPTESEAPPGYLDYCARMRAAAGVASIRWLGYVPERDIDPLLKNCTLLVLPYIIRKGSSGPLSTATSLGVPVLVSRAMQVPEYATAACEPNPDGVTSAIERFLDDPSYVTAIARAGTLFSESHAAASAVDAYVEALRA